MRGVYEATIAINGLAAAKTLLYITAPSNRVVEILGARVGNASNETNEQLDCVLQRISALGTPTGTAITPGKSEQGDQAAASTVVGNITAGEPTYAAGEEFGRDGEPSVGGWRYSPLPEDRVIIQGASSLGLRILNAPAAFDGRVVLRFREIG